jgi:hypothetical protein
VGRGAVLMAETINPKYRGKVMGTVQSAWAVGWGLAVGRVCVHLLLRAARHGMARDVPGWPAAIAADHLGAP